MAFRKQNQIAISVLWKKSGSAILNMCKYYVFIMRNGCFIQIKILYIRKIIVINESYVCSNERLIYLNRLIKLMLSKFKFIVTIIT